MPKALDLAQPARQSVPTYDNLGSPFDIAFSSLTASRKLAHGGPRHKSNVLSERSESKDQPSLCPFDGEFVGLQ